MRIFVVIALCLLIAAPAFAQIEAPTQTETIEQVITKPVPPAPIETSVVRPTYEPYAYAVLQTLDKLTGRTETVTVKVGKAVAVGPLFLDVKTCQKTPPTEQPESVAFIQVWEAKPQSISKDAEQKTASSAASQWVFSGWMFASSPAVSAMDHPIYDVWLKECTARKI